MYTISVEPLSDITPRMFAVDFENRPGTLGGTPIVLAGIGELRTIQPNPILLNSVKESL